MNLNVMEDFSEIIRYENANLPLFVSNGRLSYFSNMRALGHWHDDIEIMKAVEGNFSYDVNGRTFFVKEGDAIIVNSQQMHYAYSVDGSDCKYLCILFQPKLLTGSYVINNKYINTIIHHPYLTETYLSRDKAEHRELLNIIDDFSKIPKITGYELEFMSNAIIFWMKWHKLLNSAPLISYKTIDSDIEIQKRMAEFIYKNYQNKIRLEEIAEAGGVCRSRCCQIFKKYLGKSPIDFVNGYRLQIGMNMLGDSEMSITDIAILCGFNSSSYFAEMFLKAKGCTPSEYRNEVKY